MVSKKKKMTLFWIVGSILLAWGILTLLAQRKGSEKMAEIGNSTSPKKALITYNPDLFYNLDEQICIAFAKGISENGWHSKVTTVSLAEKLNEEHFDLYVFCANTYNWAPDKPTQHLIKTIDFDGKPVVAITLGSGSTARAKQILENSLTTSGGNLLDSKEYWLMRPNNEPISDMTNVEAAIEKAFRLGQKTAKILMADK